MSDSQEFFEENFDVEDLELRHSLAMGRIAEIPEESGLLCVEDREYFKFMAEFFLDPSYEPTLPGNYELSFFNPSYAVKKLGREAGQILSFLAYESLNIIPFRAEKMLFDEVILLELFLEIYGLYTGEEEGVRPEAGYVKDAVRSYVYDYMGHSVALRIRERIDPSFSFARDIIMESDLIDISYLDKFGEYIDDDTREIASFLATLPESRIRLMADTFTEGFRLGFIATGKDISKKSVVNIWYDLGFERVIKAAMENFQRMGLRSTLMRRALYAANRNSYMRVGYSGAISNRQMEYDHRDDRAIFVDKAFSERKLQIIGKTYEEYKSLAAEFAGKAILETFGDDPFSPVFKPEAIRMDKAQKDIMLSLSAGMGAITDRYIPGEETSFTIISFPKPKIGKDFRAIFEETIKLNTLDYMRYRDMQQEIILTLEKGRKVRIKGRNGNKTDLTVSLHRQDNPDKEAVFENCVADVNIPVGETFTTPSLPGTDGVLFVSEVYLFGLRYENLEFTIKDGFITDYNCTNFPSDKANRDYIKENILHNHETLPMGEFAIGTNTTAYAMAKKYNIFSRLEILIAEKTGPHFAFGDTCYSREEDVKAFNPDGREIIARDNEHTIKRKTEENFRYYECHTDVTIPYDELDSIISVDDEGNEYPVILNGRFVVKGAEELNAPLDEM